MVHVTENVGLYNQNLSTNDVLQVLSSYLMIFYIKAHLHLHSCVKHYESLGFPLNYISLARDLFIGLIVLKKSIEVFNYVYGYGLIPSCKILSRFISKKVFEFILSLPIIRSKINDEVNVNILKVQSSVIKNNENLLQFSELPAKGLPESEIMKEFDNLDNFLQSKENWQNGKISGAVYHGGDALISLQTKSYQKFAVANQLHPDIFPSVRKMEAEVVSMVLKMFNAPDSAVGTSTSGGSESLILACLSAREYGYRYKNITSPEIIAPTTVHAGVEKACFYFKIKLHKVDLDSSYKVDIKTVSRLINSNTVLLVGSAPNFPHGVIDDISALSKLATYRKIPLHVDACLGSFIVSFMEKAGFEVPLFDFRLSGVTSISCDTHKYGFAPKGSSVIMYRNSKLRECQYYVSTDWVGGLYGSPTLAGSRPGALMVGCWSTMIHIGEEGYIKACKEIVSSSMKLKKSIINDIPEIEIIGDPIGSVISFKSSSLSIYQLSDKLTEKGWHFATLQNPAALHFAITYLTVPVIDKLIQDLKTSVDEVVASGSTHDTGDTAAVYGIAGSVKTTGIADRLIVGFIDSLYKL